MSYSHDELVQKIAELEARRLTYEGRFGTPYVLHPSVIDSEKEIPLISGEVIPRHQPVCFFNHPTLCAVMWAPESGSPIQYYLVRILSAVYGVDVEELKTQAFNGCVETSTGEVVEPDGFDAHGAPAWTRVYQII